MSIAVIKTGGKQYVVKTDSKLKVEKLNAEAGQKIDLETLLIADENGAQIEIGKPQVSTKVKAAVVGQVKDDKIIGFAKNVMPPSPNLADSQLLRYLSDEPINFVLESIIY